MQSSSKHIWRVPALLILLSVIPLVAGLFRLYGLAGGAEITPENTRFFENPVPVAAHILGSVLFCLLGAFQFSAGCRQRYPASHRVSGRIVIPSGLVVALSGLWMARYYPEVDFDGPLLYSLRMTVGSAMIIALLLGLAAILRRNIECHQAWMTRAYALGLGAGTQALTHIPWFVFPEIQGELSRALLMGAGWLINLLVAEWIIIRRRGKQVRCRHVYR